MKNPNNNVKMIIYKKVYKDAPSNAWQNAYP